MDRSTEGGVIQLAQWRDIVQHPERATVRGGDQVAAVDREVADRRHRQVELQRLPVVAVVERHVDARLGTGVQ